MARFIKFVSSLSEHKSPSVSTLLNKLKNNVQSLVGSNLRTIHLETDVHVLPGLTKPQSIANHQVYKSDPKDDWIVKLLISLMEIRDLRWEILFDEENELGTLRTDDFISMIKDVATS